MQGSFFTYSLILLSFCSLLSAQDIIDTSQETLALQNIQNIPGRDDEEIIFEYGFEDGLGDWHADGHWEISDADAHTGDRSAHIAVGEDLRDYLETPVIQIPEDLYTWFDFWVKSDMPAFDPNDNGFLDDFFRVHISVDGGGWEPVIYDYGRNLQWQENWIHYVPGTWFRNDEAEWRRMHNLSQFAGRNIRLKWECNTDLDMEGDQGSGLWIDDVRLISTDAREVDIGIEWVHVGYPLNLNRDTEGQTMIRNYGIHDLQQVRKFFAVDYQRAFPIVPWGFIEHGAGEIFPFTLDDRSLEYPGILTLRIFTQIEDDQNIVNDTTYTEIAVYPENLYQLGHDARDWNNSYGFERGWGPSALFEPHDDGVAGSFNLKAVEVLWSGEIGRRNGDVSLHVHLDRNRRPAEEIYSRNFRVSSTNLKPNLQYINLSDAEELQNLERNFWISLRMENDNQAPQILGKSFSGDEPFPGSGYFYNTNDEALNFVDHDYQLRAIISNNDLVEHDLIAIPELFMGDVAIGRPKTMSIKVFGAGQQPVRIEAVDIPRIIFDVQSVRELPFSLAAGEISEFLVTFDPDEPGGVGTALTFTCDDETPPVIRVSGNGDHFPIAEFEPGEIDFGDVEINRTREEVLLIYNAGLRDLVISDIIADAPYFSVNFEEPLTLEPDQEWDTFISFNPEAEGSYEGYIRLISNDPDPQATQVAIRGVGYDPAGISEDGTARLPEELQLASVYPNPFNDRVTINYALPRTGFTEISIISLTGQLVNTVSTGYHAAGRHQSTWSAEDMQGHKVPSGLYFCRVSGFGVSRVQRVVLIR